METKFRDLIFHNCISLRFNSFHSFSPVTPDGMDWQDLYPEFFLSNDGNAADASSMNAEVKFLDVGCGYGGLLGKPFKYEF